MTGCIDEMLPRKLAKKNTAKVDILVNKEKIEKWSNLQFSKKEIYNELIKLNTLEVKYTYRSFLRAFKLVFNPTELGKGNQSQKIEHSKEQVKIISSTKKEFKPVTGFNIENYKKDE